MTLDPAEQQPQSPATAGTPLDALPSAMRPWRGQIWPRRARLVCDKVVPLALFLAACITWAVSQLPARQLEIKEVASSLLNYTSIGFGACITALVLSIGLAPEKRVLQWSSQYAEGSQFSAFSELIFVLTWSAFSQLGLVAICFVAIFMGANIDLYPKDPTITHVGLLWLACSAAVYAFWQLLTVVSTLMQLGALTVIEAKAKS